MRIGKHTRANGTSRGNGGREGVEFMDGTEEEEKDGGDAIDPQEGGAIPRHSLLPGRAGDDDLGRGRKSMEGRRGLLVHAQGRCGGAKPNRRYCTHYHHLLLLLFI